MKHDERDPRRDGHVHRGPGEDLLKAYAVLFYPETSGKNGVTGRDAARSQATQEADS